MIAEIVAVFAFAGLFAVFGLLRPGAGCSSDPSSCGRCAGTCKKPERRTGRDDGRPQKSRGPLTEVDR